MLLVADLVETLLPDTPLIASPVLVDLETTLVVSGLRPVLSEETTVFLPTA